MLSSAETARETVARTIVALERSCLEADAALVERRWADVDAAFRAQAELTDTLARLFEACPDVAPANEPRVARRLHGIVAYRNDQLRRLRSYRDEVASRLESIGKVNAFARSFGRRAAAARVLDAQY